jgi:hypothetical protein
MLEDKGNMCRIMEAFNTVATMGWTWKTSNHKKLNQAKPHCFITMSLLKFALRPLFLQEAASQ